MGEPASETHTLIPKASAEGRSAGVGVRRDNWQIPVAVACVVLGLMIALQFRAQRGAPPPTTDREQLVTQLRSLESERNKLSLELTEARQKLSAVEESAGRRQALEATMKEQLGAARMQAGLTGLEGPGLVVTLNDSPRKPRSDEDPYFYLVHDVDLQSLVNELWASGAEAVSVNDQRVVSRTAIRCAGPVILVNTVRLVPPYVVKAIGPASDLERALKMPGGWFDNQAPLIANGGTIKIASEERVVVPAYDGPLIFRYARPTEEAGSGQEAQSRAGSAARHELAQP